MGNDENEFFEDFGARPLTEAQLEDLVADARATSNNTLRQLVEQYRTLRLTADTLLGQLEATDGTNVLKKDVQTAAQLKLLRFLVRGG